MYIYVVNKLNIELKIHFEIVILLGVLLNVLVPVFDVVKCIG